MDRERYTELVAGCSRESKPAARRFRWAEQCGGRDEQNHAE